jgi:hypothetical protein
MSSTDYGFYWNTGQPTRRMHSKSNILALSAAFHNLASPKRVQPKKTPRESFCYFDSPEVPLARTSSSKSSRRGVVGLSPQFDSENFLQYKVLRFRRKGHCSSPHLACIKKEARFGALMTQCFPRRSDRSKPHRSGQCLRTPYGVGSPGGLS